MLILQSSADDVPARAAVRVGFISTIAPYVIPEGDHGAEVDLIREALRRSGRELNAVYLPLQRVRAEFDKRHLDAAASGEPATGWGAALSAPYIEFHEAAIVDASSDIRVNTIADLSGIRVASFRGATESLGSDFKRAVAHNPRYQELNVDVDLCRLLRRGMIDAVVSDEYIYRYLDASLPAATALTLRVEEVFPRKTYEVAFHDARLRDDFDTALADMRRDGTYERIVRAYLVSGH